MNLADLALQSVGVSMFSFMLPSAAGLPEARTRGTGAGSACALLLKAAHTGGPAADDSVSLP